MEIKVLETLNVQIIKHVISERNLCNVLDKSMYISHGDIPPDSIDTAVVAFVKNRTGDSS